MDLSSKFRPLTREMRDYFLRAESHVQNSDEFYHDSNGYLVSKRKIGYRPDYEWEYKTNDRINANNYPACSFAYLQDGTHKVTMR